MGYFFAISAALCFALHYIYMKKGMKVSKDNGTFITIIQSFITFLIIFVILQYNNPTIDKMSIEAIVYFIISGFLVLFLGRLVLMDSIRKIGSGNAVAIKNAAPLFTVIFAYIFLNEDLSLKGWLACLIILSGIYHCILSQLKGEDKIIINSNYKGILLAVLAAIFFGVGDTFRKAGMTYHNDPIAGIVLGVTAATIGMFVINLLNKNWKNNFINLYRSINVYYLVAGIMSSIAMFLFYSSLKYIQVIYASILVSLEPVFTVLLIPFLLKKEEKFNSKITISIFLIFVGSVILILN